MGLVLVTPAASFPVTLTEAKAQCRVDGTDDDTLIEGLIAAATEYVELYTGRAIISQTWRVTQDAFSDAIALPKGPVISVTSVTYLDTAGDPQTASASLYTLDSVSDPAWIVRNTGEAWPSTLDGVNAVSVTFVAGYATVPPAMKQAILLLISQWHDNRAGATERPLTAMPHAVEALLTNHRFFAF